jgi:hypothetical protein
MNTMGTPDVTGGWQENPDQPVVHLTQRGLTLSSLPYVTPGGYSHVMTGKWNAETGGFDVTVTRTTSDGCVAELTGRLFQEKDFIRYEGSRSDGRCGLATEFSDNHTLHKVS